VADLTARRADRGAPRLPGCRLAGQPQRRQGSFDARAVSSLSALTPHAAGWLQGVLIAERMPLGEVLAQVARYRDGVLRCDPALAAMPVDGIFQLNDPDNILLLLQDSLPIRLVRRTRYWISVEAA